MAGKTSGGRIAAVALAVVTATALAGCSGVTSWSRPAPARTTVTAEPRTAATSRPSTAPAASPASNASIQEQRAAALDDAQRALAADVPKAGLVVMQTDIATPDRSVSMHLAVVATGSDDYTLRISDFHSTSTRVHDLFLRQFPESAGSCITDGISFGHATWGASLGADAAAPPATVDLAQAGDDPSFLRTAVLTSETTAGGCGSWVVTAAVPLTWHAPQRHPGLVVRDSGSAPGATGSVTTANGVPHLYTVAAGDTVVGLESRFGVSERDLAYLTARNNGVGWGDIHSGEQLNLDPAER
jgi:LysM repeat protein